MVHELRKSVKGDTSTLEGSADCSESRKLRMDSGRIQSDTDTGSDTNTGWVVNRKIRDLKNENTKDKESVGRTLYFWRTVSFGWRYASSSLHNELTIILRPRWCR